MHLSTLTNTVLPLLTVFSSSALAAKPSPGCSSPSSSLTTGNHTLTINAKSRWYLLRLPSPYNPSHPHRLVFTLHAMGGNSTMVANGEGGYLPWYGLPALADDPASPLATDVQTVYVAPNGLDRGWANRGGEDAMLIATVADTLKAGLCIDENLVFSVGFSYGASMSYAVACALADTFRAVAMQSGGNMSGCATGADGTAPIAVYGQHGMDGTDLPIPMARQIRDRFVRNNGCTPVADVESVKGSGGHRKVVYEGCREGYPVTWIEYDGGHTPQPRDRGQNKTWSAEETWGFFRQFK